MRARPRRGRGRCRRGVLAAALAGVSGLCFAGEPAGPSAQDALRSELAKLPWRIVYESYRGRDWELFSVRADGSDPVNLTKSPDTDDLYPHASPDGTKVCFLVDEGTGEARRRNVYLMNADGGGRQRIAENARQPCWAPDGRRIAYMKGEFERFTYTDYASKGMMIYEVQTGAHRPHVNDALHHLYNVCWSPDGHWLTATVHGGMGHKHANLAIQADGPAVFKLPGVGGCRPDISPDGKRLCWNASDQALCIADVDFSGSGPAVRNVRAAITCPKTHEVYHADWSPDGRYIAFSHGPKAAEQIGKLAKDWRICVADASKQDVWVAVTRDGVSDKEPDWLPQAKGNAR